MERMYDYVYPYGLDLHPDSELHRRLCDEIRRRSEFAYAQGSKARDRARQIDMVLYNFVSTDEHEDILKSRGSGNVPAPLKIIIPISKAVLDTWVTYMAGTFLDNPYGLYQLRGRGSKGSREKALLLEILLNTQANWFGHDSKLITFWRDCYAYGLGAIMPIWDKHKYKVPNMTVVDETLYEILKDRVSGVGVGDVIRYIEERVIHEGNNLVNIDFYSVFIDPSTSINDSDKFEYAGYFERANILNYLNKELDPEEHLFNCRYARDRIGSSVSNIDFGRIREYSIYDSSSDKRNNCVVTHFFWKLVPNEWGLGDSEYPEVYYFRVVNNEVIISVINLEYITGALPIIFGAPNTDGYDTYPVSALATTFGIQKYVDWKIRSQVANQAKVLNDMIIVDPNAFEMEDLLNPEPGKIIRLSRSLYGGGRIDDYIKQFAVVDVTSHNVSDIMVLINLMYQILGTTDIVMGDLSRLPERPTAQGIMLARSSALSRLQKDAQILVSQMWHKLVFQMAANTILFMSNDVMLDIAGTKYENLVNNDNGIIYVSPSDLSMDFDIVPINKFKQEANLQSIAVFLERALQNPNVVMALMQQFNIPEIFKAYMRKIGFEDIDDYIINQPTVQVMSDEEVINELQKGNIVPVQPESDSAKAVSEKK